MKVIVPEQMAEIEAKAYHEGSSEADFMEEAGSGVALVVHDLVEEGNLDHQVILLCGKGNNAGDAYVAGTHLRHLDYEVTAYTPFPFNESSELCQQNHYNFINDGGHVYEFKPGDHIHWPVSGVIIDGLFGTGFKGSVEEPVASLIRQANLSRLPIVSVDIPSGLDGKTGIVQNEAIIALVTAFLGLPKTGFFLNQGWNYVGSLSYVNFGLPQSCLDAATPDMIMLSPDLLKPLVPSLVRNRHKYQAGHVVGLGCSTTMPGAGLLASLSSLCSGAGIVHLLYPEEMRSEFSAIPYELIKIPYRYSDSKTVLEWINKGSAAFIGPGIGLGSEIRKLLSKVLPKLEKPCVIDADALTILSEEKLPFPAQCILTPHLGEMKKLLHLTEVKVDYDFLQTCRDFAEKKQVTLVLKGGPSFVFHPGQPIFVNPKGDPGMATAGSGDVLTGLLASLLAQGLSTQHAAMLGIYLHAVAGEMAASHMTSYCMTASDIITYFPDAFRPNQWIE